MRAVRDKKHHVLVAPPHTDPRAIGILGGIFNPPHNGHFALAHCACDFFGLRTFYVVPSGRPPHKTTPEVSAQHRCAMLRIALANDPALTLWDGEIRRRGVSYTIDTLVELSERHPGAPLYFVIGADNLSEIPTWHRYREILDRVTLCVASRPGYSLRVPPALASATILTFPSPEWGISSTMIRAFLGKGMSCRYLVPDAVLEYISKYALYV